MFMSPDCSVIETCCAFSNSLECLLMNTTLESHWSVKLFLEQNNILVLGLCVYVMIFFLLNSWIAIRIWQGSVPGGISRTVCSTSRPKQRYVIAPVVNKWTGEETKCIAQAAGW